jgi:uncharacterized protein (TIGR03000 family)
MNKFLSITALAGLGLTLVATDADACCFRRKQSNNCCAQAAPVATPCCGVAYGTVGTPAYAAGAPAVAMPVVPTPMATPVLVDKPGTVTVLVPSADAQVWFEDTALPQSGKERTFNTPPLMNGKTYNYNVKAKWTNDNGKAVEKILPVSVKAGQTTTVDFR